MTPREMRLARREMRQAAAAAAIKQQEDRSLKINLISRDNGVGLSTDMELLGKILAEAGHSVQRVDWTSRQMRSCDVGIFLELFNPRLVRYARYTVGIFNLEWFVPRWRRYLPRISQLWAKSGDAHNAFQSLKLNSHLTGFLSRDLYDESVQRTMTCLHLRGHSSEKNTEAVVEAWRCNPDLPPLTIISQDPIEVVPGITVLPRLPQEELTRQLNTHQIHVCPSRTEGWGHYITEGLSAGAIVITTDAPPMNEHVHPDWGMLVPTSRSAPRNLVQEHDVDPEHIASAVRRITALTDEQRAGMSEKARAHTLYRNESFRQTALKLLEQLCT